MLILVVCNQFLWCLSCRTKWLEPQQKVSFLKGNKGCYCGTHSHRTTLSLYQCIDQSHNSILVIFAIPCSHEMLRDCMMATLEREWLFTPDIARILVRKICRSLQIDRSLMIIVSISNINTYASRYDNYGF